MYVSDFMAFDKEERPVLVVEVGAGKQLAQLRHRALQLLAGGVRAPFALLVNEEAMELVDPKRPTDTIARLRTMDMLGLYAPRPPRKSITEDYLSTLVEAWLRDLAFHWKSDRPPGAGDAGFAGVALRLEGGSTAREARVL